MIVFEWFYEKHDFFEELLKEEQKQKYQVLYIYIIIKILLVIFTIMVRYLYK